MSALAILDRTRALIPTPAQWTRGAMARDAAGQRVDPESDEAVCWCPFGAYMRASDCGLADGAERAHAALSHGCASLGGGGSITSFGDRPGRTHAQVLQAISLGIESLKGAQ